MNMKKWIIAVFFAASAGTALGEPADVNAMLEEMSTLLWEVRDEIVADIDAGRDTDIRIEKTLVCKNEEGEIVDGEYIDISFSGETLVEQQFVRLGFAYSSWIVGWISEFGIGDHENLTVICNLEDGYVELPEFEEEVIIISHEDVPLRDITVDSSKEGRKTITIGR